jgi:hypothetical protein
VGRLAKVPLSPYVELFEKLSPATRRLVIYDQLKPRYAKYYCRDEAVGLMKTAFREVALHHRPRL